MGFEQVAEELHIELVVLDDENSRLARARTRSPPLDRRLALLVSHRFGPLDCGHRTFRRIASLLGITVRQKPKDMFKNAGSRGAGGAARMHRSNDRGTAPSLESARQLALDALLYLASDELRMSKFLQATGMDATDLRSRARADGTLVAVLEYLLADESMLLVFAANGSHPPGAVLPALERLQNEGGIG
jgi:hypothetical protein